MKSRLLIAGVLFSIFASSAKATTVVFGSNPSARTIASEAGANYTSTTGTIWVGTFSNEAGFSSTANNSLDVATNVAAIKAAGGWEQFTVDTTADTVNAGTSNTVDFTLLSGSARVGGTISDNNTGSTKADFFNNKSIYIWIFNADTIAASTEMGIFKATAATVPWLFPTNAGGLGDSVTLSTTVAGATIAEVNGVGLSTGTQLRTEAFGTGPVPEPSRLMLLGLSAVGLVFRRRRA